MPAKNTLPFTLQGVLDYITKNRGIRYQCSQLARVFKVPSPTMKEVVTELAKSGKVRTNVTGRYRFYFLMTFAEMELERRGKEVAARECKQWTVSQQMRDALARCAEIRTIPSKF